MTDTNQTPVPGTQPIGTATAPAGDTTQRENALEAAEECIAQNKGLIMNCLTSLPGPILVLVKGFVNILLIPLHLLASLPLDNIYNSLKDFAGDGSGSCPPTPTPPEDCTKTNNV